MNAPKTSSHTCDFLIVGGGIVGLSIAREIKRKFKDTKVVLVEKEEECGLHASSRNSGVLHAGFYYTKNSLKAKFSRVGNAYLTSYCEEKKLPINKCGKLVVAQDQEDLKSLEELFVRGKQNGVLVEEVSEEKAKAIEPRAKTYKKALFSPTTSSVNPSLVMQSIKEDALNEGVEIDVDTAYLGFNGDEVKTSKKTYSAGYVINAAGLYADKIARDFGFSEDYRILPFKGLYLYSDEDQGSLNTHIYPVPNLKNPFLGTHFTVTVDGKVKIGPTAIPVFWREQYQGLDNFKVDEFFDIFLRQVGLITFSKFDFKRLAFDEMKKYSKKKLVSLASNLVHGIDSRRFTTWGKPGIRAQLVNTKKKELVMDFVIEKDKKSMHILNAVSPGFTCAIPFAQYLVEKIEE